MVLIKSYRVEGISHTGTPYTMDMPFIPIHAANRCYFDEEKGIPLVVAEDLVKQWNRTVKMYGQPTMYSIIMPEPEMPVAPSCSSTAKSDIEGTSMDAAFELVKHGRWSLDQFEEWVLSITSESHNDGYDEALVEAKEMIDSLLKE